MRQIDLPKVPQRYEALHVLICDDELIVKICVVVTQHAPVTIRKRKEMLAVEVTQVQMELAQHTTGYDEGVLLRPIACVGRAQIGTVRATQQSPLLMVFEQQP